MLNVELAKKAVLSCFMVATFTVLSGSPAVAQSHGAVPLPPAKPSVDQLGTMQVLDSQDRFGLVVMLSLQVLACIAVAIALAGHLSLPSKRKAQ